MAAKAKTAKAAKEKNSKTADAKSIAEAKSKLRGDMTWDIRDLVEEARLVYSRKICQHFMTSKLHSSEPKNILIFAADDTEPNLLPLIEVAEQHRYCFPKVGPKNTMTIHHVPVQEELAQGAFGLLEPTEEHEIIKPEKIDLAFIPGRAFGRSDGGRLGRGGGYYDRFLEKMNQDCQVCGVAFSLQLKEEVPLEDHDYKMTSLLTESGFIEIKEIA